MTDKQATDVNQNQATATPSTEYVSRPVRRQFSNAYKRRIVADGAFFMRQNLLSVPGELVDAARIDGAPE